MISVKLNSNFVKILCLHGCFPVNLLHIFRTVVLTNTYVGLFRQIFIQHVCHIFIQICVLFSILLATLQVALGFCSQIEFSLNSACCMKWCQTLVSSCNPRRKKKSYQEILEVTPHHDARQQHDLQTFHEGHALLLSSDVLELHLETTTNAGRPHQVDYRNVPTTERKQNFLSFVNNYSH